MLKLKKKKSGVTLDILFIIQYFITHIYTIFYFTFPKKDQAIIFNTIDGIPQIEYIRVLSTLTNPSNIKFASRISNNRFCVYFANKSIVENIINQNHTINVNNHIISIRKLINPTKRIIISNVSP
ncbi:Reverse transcriptase domain-containing protein, partial [Aphis craccivora]